MKKEINYVQCALEKNGSHHMAWIPEKFAVVDKFIKIKQDDDSWQDGWQVKGIADAIKRTATDANQALQGYKKFGGSIK
jgi:hypothetical protein